MLTQIIFHHHRYAQYARNGAAGALSNRFASGESVPSLPPLPAHSLTRFISVFCRVSSYIVEAELIGANTPVRDEEHLCASALLCYLFLSAFAPINSTSALTREFSRVSRTFP